MIKTSFLDWNNRKYCKLVSGDEVFVDTKASANLSAERIRQMR